MATPTAALFAKLAQHNVVRLRNMSECVGSARSLNPCSGICSIHGIKTVVPPRSSISHRNQLSICLLKRVKWPALMRSGHEFRNFMERVGNSRSLGFIVVISTRVGKNNMAIVGIRLYQLIYIYIHIDVILTYDNTCILVFDSKISVVYDFPGLYSNNVLREDINGNIIPVSSVYLQI